jgi:hypothetical protein
MDNDDMLEGAAAIALAYWGHERPCPPRLRQPTRTAAVSLSRQHKAAIRAQKQALRLMMEKAVAEAPIFTAAVQQEV